MKRYVYLLIDEEREVVAIYDRYDLAQKLLTPISEKLEKELVIEKKLVNPDIKVVGI